MMRKLKPIFVQQELLDRRLQVFSPLEFSRIFQVSLRATQEFLKRYSKPNAGLFYKLRNGLYCLKTHHPSSYLLANKIYRPSYVSLDTALAHYGMIPEIVYSVTSVTTKATREFTTPWLIFDYQKIKRQAFTGYRPMEIDGTTVLIAEPEKALVDFLYFVDLKQRLLNDRLDLKKISLQKALHYAKIFNRPSLVRLVKQLYARRNIPQKIF